MSQLSMVVISSDSKVSTRSRLASSNSSATMLSSLLPPWQPIRASTVLITLASDSLFSSSLAPCPQEASTMADLAWWALTFFRLASEEVEPLRVTILVVLESVIRVKISSSISSLSTSAKITTLAFLSLSLAMISSRMMSITRSFHPRIKVCPASTTLLRPLRKRWIMPSSWVVMKAISMEKITTPIMPATIMVNLSQADDSVSTPMLPGSVMARKTAQMWLKKLSRMSTPGKISRMIQRMNTATTREATNSTRRLRKMDMPPLAMKFSNL